MTVVAIDGPAGAGKSTVSKRVAARLGFRYLDTGAMYRALALVALENDIDLTDGDALARAARDIELSVDGSSVSIGDRDVSARVRDPDVTEAVSTVSAHPDVRGAMLDRQRDLARRENVVIEGRDIGSHVVPDAAVKVFLTASLQERARRRCEQAGESCDDANIERVARSIAERDEADSEREASPLVQAQDATVIDSTGMAIDDVIEAIVALARKASS